MTRAIDLADHHLVALSRSALAALRAALLRDAGPAAASCLQEAGYAGGETVFASFSDWLREWANTDPDALDVEEFQTRASEYFQQAGWGTLTIASLNDAVATVDTEDWGEADPSAKLDHPSCHLTTGMFADFFGRVSDVPLAVLEVECRSMGAHRCRFLLGSGDVLTYVFQEIERGTPYEKAVESVK
jgi:predicted hydrocarbon binding protein